VFLLRGPDLPGDGRHAPAPLPAPVLQSVVRRALDADPAQAAWVGGMLAADRMPLGELLGELARYRSGRLRCDPEVAALAVSGAFPLDDIERSLAMLEAIYPLAVRRGAGGWWITVGPRGA